MISSCGGNEPPVQLLVFLRTTTSSAISKLEIIRLLSFNDIKTIDLANRSVILCFRRELSSLRDFKFLFATIFN